ncbi:hypothetical protein ACLOJK_004307 [Asimina triloba]
MCPQHRLDIVALLRPARFCRQFVFLPYRRLVIATLSSPIVLSSPLLDVRENQVQHRSLHARRSSPYRVSSSAHRRHIVRMSSSSVIFSSRPLLLFAPGFQRTTHQLDCAESFSCYRTTGIAPDLCFLYNLIRGLLKMGDFYRAILAGANLRGRVHAIKIQLLHFDVQAVKGWLELRCLGGV